MVIIEALIAVIGRGRRRGIRHAKLLPSLGSRQAARRHAKLLQGLACDSDKARGCADMACRIILGRSKVERGSIYFQRYDGVQFYLCGEL